MAHIRQSRLHCQVELESQREQPTCAHPAPRTAPRAQTLHQASAAAGGGQLAPADLAAALRRYEAGRAPRVARVRDTADGIFFRGVGETAWGRLKRDLLYW